MNDFWRELQERVRRAVADDGGELTRLARAALDGDGRGTTVEATFRRSHIDRAPLGDVPGTLLVVLVGALLTAAPFILERF